MATAGDNAGHVSTLLQSSMQHEDKGGGPAFGKDDGVGAVDVTDLDCVSSRRGQEHEAKHETG
jgi:hypothetical protein